MGAILVATERKEQRGAFLFAHYNGAPFDQGSGAEIRLFSWAVISK